MPSPASLRISSQLPPVHLRSTPASRGSIDGASSMMSGHSSSAARHAARVDSGSESTITPSKSSAHTV